MESAWRPIGTYHRCHTQVAGAPALKVTTIGSSSGLILSKEVMNTLKVGKGDLLYLTEAPSGAGWRGLRSWPPTTG